MWHHAHLMDAMAGTHLVPPSYALPPEGTQPAYAPEVRGWLEEYEKVYGPRRTSSMTTEQVPLEWTSGPARVIDVRSLIGSTNKNAWPSSPEVTPAVIKRYESQTNELRSGQVVILFTGHLDKYYKALPVGDGVWTDPLKGKSEGWPALTADAVKYLKSKGIRCVATDAPDLGGVDPKRALMTYWALGSYEMVGVEFLNNVSNVADGNYFVFVPLKIQNCHGGPGRAIAFKVNEK